MTIEGIAHELAEALKKADADYVEARLEESQISRIAYRGRELESIGRSAARGGNIRAGQS
jgi:predicted Zn-dependent protease